MVQGQDSLHQNIFCSCQVSLVRHISRLTIDRDDCDGICNARSLKHGTGRRISSTHESSSLQSDRLPVQSLEGGHVWRWKLTHTTASNSAKVVLQCQDTYPARVELSVFPIASVSEYTGWKGCESVPGMRMIAPKIPTYRFYDRFNGTTPEK